MSAEIRAKEFGKIAALPRSRQSGVTPRKLRPSENHLYFDAVVRHGSIRKAADTLHMASSALNRRILDLEHEVGTALFERLPRGVRLTGAGELLLDFVRKSLKDLRRVEIEIDQLRGEMRGLIRIAVAESVTPSLLPAAIERYQIEHPGIGFQVQVAGPEALFDALTKDRVDLILTHDGLQGPATSVLATARHPLSVLVAPGHPLAKLARVSLADCVHYPLAVPDHSLAARALLDLAMEEAALPLRPSLESDSIETLKAFARLGNAVCLSFRLGGDESSPGLVSLALTDPRCAEASLHLMARRGRVLPVAAASFAELMTKTFHENMVSQSVSVA